MTGGPGHSGQALLSCPERARPVIGPHPGSRTGAQKMTRGEVVAAGHQEWSQGDSNPQPPACKRLSALEIKLFSGAALSVGVRAYPCSGTQFGTQIGTGSL